MAEMSVSAVAKQLGEVDTTLWSISHYQVEQAKKKQLDFSEVRRICVDETASKRGHNYVTIFSDADSADVLYQPKAEHRKACRPLFRAF